MTSKNDKAWEKLFLKYSILDKIEKEGFFAITSKQINEFRGSRLTTKLVRQNKFIISYLNNVEL